MTYEIDNPEIQGLLRQIAERIGGQMPKGWGFTLLLFEFTPGDSLFYISSAQRPDMVKMMQKFVRRQTIQ